MMRVMKLVAVGALLALPACSKDKNEPSAPQLSNLTGTWTGKFSNGIGITMPLVQTGTTLSGTFNTGDTQGSVSGTHSATTFNISFTKTSSTGTQRNLTGTTLSSDSKRITGNWNDGGGGLTGTFCLAAPSSPACP
jgi:hypothetical protein